MNLLELIRDHAGSQGLPAPVTVNGSSNPHALQARGLLNDFIDDLVTRRYWERNVRTASWSILPTQDQGEVEQLAPDGFEGIMPNSFFCANYAVPMQPATPAQWAQVESRNVMSLPYIYHLEGGHLYLNYPNPPVGGLASFKYYSGCFVRSATGLYKRRFQEDTDTCILGDSLPLAYLRWKWRREKGMDYAEEFAAYERLLHTKLARDGGAGPLSLNPENCNYMRPGIFVPEYARSI